MDFKAGVYAAALEYLQCQTFGYDGTQNKLAAKYDVSPGVISQRSKQILSFVKHRTKERKADLSRPLQAWMPETCTATESPWNEVNQGVRYPFCQGLDF